MDRGRAVARGELAVEATRVLLDRVGREMELTGDLPVGRSHRDESQHLELTDGQPARERGGRRPGGEVGTSVVQGPDGVDERPGSCVLGYEAARPSREGTPLGDLPHPGHEEDANARHRAV